VVVRRTEEEEEEEQEKEITVGFIDSYQSKCHASTVSYAVIKSSHRVLKRVSLED